MKKSVIVLCFALCGTLAFAQTKHAPARTMQKTQNVAAHQMRTTAPEKKVDYKASIFNTKDAGDILMQCEFSALNDGYTTGVITSTTNSYLAEGGTGSVLVPIHAQVADHSQWQRVSDTSFATMTALNSVYPYLFGQYFRRVGISDYFVPQTGDNGFMLMSMLDYVSDQTTGYFDAYIQFDAVATTGSDGVTIEFNQYYAKFNRDQCFIDYNTGSGWRQMEINVKNVDIEVNDEISGQFRTLLPAACANQASLQLRIRWASESPVGGTYGYWWMIDDVVVSAAYQYETSLIQQFYVNGNYHMIPQGMEIPITWYASLKNEGFGDQSGVNVTVNHLDANRSNGSQIATKIFGSLNSGATGTYLLDGATTVQDGDGWWSVNYNMPQGATVANMPATTAGDNFVYATYGSAQLPDKSLDTIIYKVNNLENDPSGKGQFAVWALDNGVLYPRSYWTDGFTSDGYLTTRYDDDNASYTHAGYRVYNRFVTGNNIPDGWVIRGMQLVAATQNGCNVAPMSHINADLMIDYFADDTSTSFGLYGIETGAPVYETRIEDFNYYSSSMQHYTQEEMNANEYKEYGDYNVINILFPQQPALQPRTAYRLGYTLQDGYFAVAANTTSYVHHYDGDPDTVLWRIPFAGDTNNGGYLKKYGYTFHPGMGQNQFFQDPDEDGYLHPGSSAMPPMIRMLVGPSYTYPTHNVTIQCQGEGGATYYGDSDDDQCGQTVTMIEGSNQIYFEAEEGYQVLELYVDGVSVMIDTTDVAFDETVVYRYTYNGSDVVRYTFPNLTEDATIRVVFGERQGIDKAAANVKMNLFPNPANNNVQLSIAGVNGTVNCAILDMSGRVVYNQNINAEATTNINLSNLAKGAYFVRITNDKFTKVEKLIVR